MKPSVPSDLKPCPFCGGSAEAYDRFNVKCTGCGAEINAQPGEAPEMWNNRALAPSWIAVGERLPKEGISVLVYRRITPTEGLVDKTCLYGNDFLMPMKAHNITHWMPLPEPPR